MIPTPEAQGANNGIESYINYIIPLVVASVGGCVAIYVWRGKRAKDGKDTFRLFIRRKISELPKLGIRDFYRNTKPEIHTAIECLKHFLSTADRTRIDRLWQEYDEITDSELDDSPLAAMVGHISNVACPDQVTQSYEEPAKIIRRYLDQFYEFSQ